MLQASVGQYTCLSETLPLPTGLFNLMKMLPSWPRLEELDTKEDVYDETRPFLDSVNFVCLLLVVWL